MPKIDVPVNEKFILSVSEASDYFGVGEKKLRQMISVNRNADYLLWNGTKPLIKRILFEKYIATINSL